jgi:hypothetical protein
MLSQKDALEYSIGYANSEIESPILDTMQLIDTWLKIESKYTNGQLHKQERVFISQGCSSESISNKCICSYQKQIYYQNEDHVLMMKEGKYITQNKGIQTFKHYEYWYNEEGKLMHKTKVKSTERMKF